MDTKMNIPAGSPALLDVGRVAQKLRCSSRHVYRLPNAGRMPRPMKLGALVRWSKVAIEEWIAGGCRPVTSPHPERQVR